MKEQMVLGIIGKLNEKVSSNHRDIDGLMYRTANYTKPRTYDFLTDYQPLTKKDLFTGCNTVFIKGNVTFPNEICADEDYEDFMFLRFHNLEGTVYIDGEPYHGIDKNRDRIPLRKEWAGKTMEVLVEGNFSRNHYDLDVIAPTCLAYAYFCRIDKKIEQYIYDILLADEWHTYDCENAQEENLYIRRKITEAFEASYQELDFSLEGTEFREAVIRADDIFRKKINAIDDGDVRSHVNLVASTHIDTAWLWQLKDTIRKCAHSFSSVFRLMESYPEFKFTCSQVKQLAYTKEYYPALYEQIKSAVKEGRWENVGSMWVESDCNMVSGESMTRQILYGVDFLEKEFGARSRVAWLPDVFGFQANLPQIFKKSGMDYFYSYKLHWQAMERFPFSDFKWKGIDGSEIICSIIDNKHGAYNGKPNPTQLRDVKKDFPQNGIVDEIIFPYGFGDGGGGPTREMVEYAKRMEDFPGLPKCEISTAQDFFDRLEKYRDELPLWYGELYIQTHRGTFTTEASIKKNNRHVEMLYQSLEKLAVMAEQYGAKPDWDILRQGWEKALVLQFHDVLPGTSIQRVCDDCKETYKELFDIADRFIVSMGLERKIRISEGIRVLNTLSWDRDVLTTFKCPIDEIGDGTVKIVSGEVVMPCSIVKGEYDAEITFLAKNVKAMSYVDYDVLLEKEIAEGRKMLVTQSEDTITVDNERYNAVIDCAGRLLSLFDKKCKKQILSAPANNVKLFLDGPCEEDAWNIYEEYKKREVKLFESCSSELTENNDLRTVIHVHNVGKKVDFSQDIIFYHDKDRIDFKTHIDWHEQHKILRVYFPTKMQAPYFTSETGFGAYSRPTVGSTTYEKSKFEVVAHRWVDISENGYGVALLNDSKYGHDVQYDTIGLTLLRSTSFPAQYPDMGGHDFTYSLLPHDKNWASAGVAQAGIELNAEVYTVSAIGKGQLFGQLFTCDNNNMIIDTVKKTENDDGIVLRLYEANGTSGCGKIAVGKTIYSAVESNLVEKEIKDANLEGNTIQFEFTPYEIKTFIVKFA